MLKRLRRFLGSADSADDQQVLSPAVMTFSAAVCVATLSLVGLGYFATRQWLRDADLLVDRRSSEALALLSSAIDRDMKGAWVTLIVPTYQLTKEEDAPYDLMQPVARTFARFPYPESFVLWKFGQHADGTLYVFNRADRRPAWDQGAHTNDPFPVTLLSNPPVMQQAIADLRHSISNNGFAYRNLVIAGAPYQVVAHMIFSPYPPYGLVELAAFTVNLDWVRKDYFAPLLSQVLRIGGNEDSLSFSVVDERGQLVAGTSGSQSGARVSERHFPMLFVDPALLPFTPGSRTAAPEWTVRVSPTRDNTLLSALQNAQRTFVLLALAGGVSVLSLFLAVRAIRASAMVASMKSEFVSTVTHELKTPLSLIRLVGDTLAKDRYTSTETIREYAQLLSQEALRLSRTVDHLLVYAKHSTALSGQGGSFEPAQVGDLVEHALEQFRPALEQQGFALHVDLPEQLPRVRVDSASIVLVIENIVDNAIKYSGDTKALTITARPAGRRVRLTFADQGLGIRTDDLPRVFDRFYRGQNVFQSGSGLGLAIAKRIVGSHGGTIDITSTVNAGTEVAFDLPAAD